MALESRRFVVHEHHSRRLHYDLRLEMAGVFKSWALPKGPSLNPADRRLAVLAEDHSLAYIDFEGIIPAGRYGAGAVIIWDQGTYDLLQVDDPVRAVEGGKMALDFHGKVLQGGFVLLQMKPPGQGNWLLIKQQDGFARTDWLLEPAWTLEKETCLRERTPPEMAHRCQALGLPMR